MVFVAVVATAVGLVVAVIVVLTPLELSHIGPCFSDTVLPNLHFLVRNEDDNDNEDDDDKIDLEWLEITFLESITSCNL